MLANEGATELSNKASQAKEDDRLDQKGMRQDGFIVQKDVEREDKTSSHSKRRSVDSTHLR